MVIGRSCICARGLALARLRQVIGMLAELLGRGAELDHVALGEHGEHLARRQQPVRHVQLVVGASAADDLAARGGQAVPDDRSGRSARGTPAPWSPARTGSRRRPGRPSPQRRRRRGRPRPSTSRWAGRRTRRDRGGRRCPCRSGRCRRCRRVAGRRRRSRPTPPAWPASGRCGRSHGCSRSRRSRRSHSGPGGPAVRAGLITAV